MHNVGGALSTPVRIGGAIDSLLLPLIRLAMAAAAVRAARLPTGQTLWCVAMMDGFILFLILLLPLERAHVGAH